MTDENTRLAERLTAALAARADAAELGVHGHGSRGRGARTDDNDPTDRSLPAHRRRRTVVAATASSVLVAAAAIAVSFAVVPDAAPSGDGGPGAGQPAQSNAPATTTDTAESSAPSTSPTRLAVAAGRQAVRVAGARRAQATDPAVGPDQYRLQRTIQAQDGGALTVDETWAPSGRLRAWVRIQRDQDGGSASRWSGVCNDLYQQTQDPPEGRGCDRPGSFGDLSPDFVASLPRDPDALYRSIHADAAASVNPEKVHSADYLTVMTIDSMLASNAVPASLAGALVQALARIPSARVIEGATTCRGRTGLGVEVTAQPGRPADGAPESTLGIIVDPRSGAYLGSYSGHAGGVDYRASDVTVRVVDQAPPR